MRIAGIRPIFIVILLAFGTIACSQASVTPTGASAVVRQPETFASVGASSNAVSGAAAAGSELADVRRATAKYHDYDAAVADGYLIGPNERCVPGMGYHALNPGLIDGTIDALQPEVLLYEPLSNGKWKLIGVEYFIPAALAGATPSLFGTNFYGPMPGHAPGMPVHYDLHAWLWLGNPDGTLATFNPKVTCN